MSRTSINPRTETILPEGAKSFLKRRAFEFIGLGLVSSGLLIFAALISYVPSDPSFNSATSEKAHNLLGLNGAYLADFLLQSVGLIGVAPSLVLTVWGIQTIRKRPPTKIWARVTLFVLTIIMASMSISVLPVPSNWPLMTSLGGAVGIILLDHSMLFLLNVVSFFNVPLMLESWMLALFLALITIAALITVLGLTAQDWQHVLHLILKVGGYIWRKICSSIFSFFRYITTILITKIFSDNALKHPTSKCPTKRTYKATQKSSPTSVSPKTANLKTGRKAVAKRQIKFDLMPGEAFELPPHDLLEAPPEGTISTKVNKGTLQQNARLLEAVLKDFGVHGKITNVRPGPVVTLYELEPAPGTKTSRVISLGDDIARSMSAVSVRVAVVQGRNAIGIELPNLDREMVFLRELLTSDQFERSAGKLNVALGKDIGGLPITVDLSRMPHLLIAGTTGSGKSVGINTMILSFLYQFSPENCKLIMIDPKMLELSVYEGIPHLLTPVVTEPSKAVMALKWAVREMEERYRAMSQLGVRNIAGYNNRLTDAIKKNEVLTRRVQTGFDTEGKPIHEDQPLSMEPLPFIVIIIDEMADLMLVAGKEVEAAVQRLAQMARAAGIHMIMATQRPSVDVITGTIKANFPTRISFQVTSKIDSRTILGEQGAEQLLGQGDMLYMAGGGRITRVHGPFVSDEEVEHVVTFLKSQGKPQYLQEITEEVEPENSILNGSGLTTGDELYDDAVALIAREGKASTSFIQRHLQIGYNRAARIIERMESEGVVSKANRVGRREVLVGEIGKAVL